MEKSTQTRNLIFSRIDEKTEFANIAKGKAEGKRAYVAEHTKDELKIKKLPRISWRLWKTPGANRLALRFA
jgi:hypothetical protein